ncbi:MAG: beta-galactosidase [Planctomycetota bacterium]|jgi:beta-galactosidase|nr:beta-galactosidase [Planctomycetota bacterium]
MLTTDDRLRFGACWYPEHWPQERWAEDLRLMREAGMTCVRIGEGAWTECQPSADRFDWSFLDRVLDLCAEHGIGAILGTPTYCAPAWLETAHPEIIALRDDGSPWYRHSRRYYDYTQAAYRDACRAIVSAEAERYARDERIWAWQVDNEMFCHLGAFWGESVRTAFQAWLAERYGDITRLNEAWGMAFWSNQLENFAQADLPGPTVAHYNHHQQADYRYFLADLGRDFLFEQRDIIKAVEPNAVVLHNCPFAPIDRADLLEGLDVYGHDHYPRFAEGAVGRARMGLNYSRFRHYAKRLWVVEQQASQVGQTSYRRPVSPPGELSVAALQSIAHGCDLLTWFRWRSYHAAQETNWGGLLPHWGQPGRYYDEAKDLITALAPHAETIAATKPRVSVARLMSFRQETGAYVEPWIGEQIEGEGGRGALVHLGLNENTVRPGDLKPYDQYQVALLPLAIALDEDEVAAIRAWVEAGGTLVVGPMAGHRDAQLHAPVQAEPPGLLAELTGTANGEGTTTKSPVRIRATDGGETIDSSCYAEIIEPRLEGTRVLATHLSGWLTGSAAVVDRQLGRGRVLHVGVALGDKLLEWLWMECNLPRPPAAMAVHEDGAEVLTRECDGYALHFVLNHGAASAIAYLYHQVTDLLTGEELTNSFTVPSYGYRILREELR